MFPDGSHLAEPSNEELANKLGLERMAMQHAYDLIIVGGGPAGLTTSIYAAREKLETLIIDRRASAARPGSPSASTTSRASRRHRRRRFADRLVRQARRFGVELLQALPSPRR